MPGRQPAARIDRAITLAQIVEVVLGIADHGRLAGGARRGVDAHDLLRGIGEHAERVVVAQVVLGGEGEPGEVGEGLADRRDGRRPRRTWRDNAAWVVGAMERPLHPLELQRGDFVAAGDLDGLEQARLPDLARHRFPRLPSVRQIAEGATHRRVCRRAKGRSFSRRRAAPLTKVNSPLRRIAPVSPSAAGRARAWPCRSNGRSRPDRPRRSAPRRRPPP